MDWVEVRNKFSVVVEDCCFDFCVLECSCSHSLVVSLQ